MANDNPAAWQAATTRVANDAPVTTEAEARHAVALLLILPWDEAVVEAVDAELGVWLVPAPDGTTPEALVDGWADADAEYSISIEAAF